MRVKVLVACEDMGGIPTLTPMIVHCNAGEYADGRHYDAARNEAEAHYYSRILVMDENDNAPVGVFEAFDWSEAPEIIVFADEDEEEA